MPVVQVVPKVGPANLSDVFQVSIECRPAAAERRAETDPTLPSTAPCPMALERVIRSRILSIRCGPSEVCSGLSLGRRPWRGVRFRRDSNECLTTDQRPIDVGFYRFKQFFRLNGFAEVGSQLVSQQFQGM